jgi:hypothetical protein
MWTKPAFEEFYKNVKEKGDHNELNVVSKVPAIRFFPISSSNS